MLEPTVGNGVPSQTEYTIPDLVSCLTPAIRMPHVQ